MKGNVGKFWCPPGLGRATKCDSTENQGEFCPEKRAGMHRTGSVELKSLGRKAEPGLNDPTPASVVETVHKLYLHSPELPKSWVIIPWNNNVQSTPPSWLFPGEKIPGNQIRKHHKASLLLPVSFYRQMDPWKKKKKK